MSLITVQQYKDFLGIPASDTTKDTAIASLDPDVQDYFQQLTGKYLTPTAFVYLMNGTGTDMVVLPYKPLVSVSRLEVLNVAGQVIITYTPPDNIVFDPNSGRVRVYLPAIAIPPEFLAASGNFLVEGSTMLSSGNFYRFPSGNLNVRATFTAGYATVPNSVLTILKRLMAFWLDSSRLGAASQHRIGELSVSRITDMLPVDLRMALEGYRRVLIG